MPLLCVVQSTRFVLSMGFFDYRNQIHQTHHNIFTYEGYDSNHQFIIRLNAFEFLSRNSNMSDELVIIEKLRSVYIQFIASES